MVGHVVIVRVSVGIYVCTTSYLLYPIYYIKP